VDLVYTFKFKTDSFSPIYSPIYFKCDTLRLTYLLAPTYMVITPVSLAITENNEEKNKMKILQRD
jgi:hypothetical protein